MKRILLAIALSLGFASAFADSAPSYPGGQTAMEEYIKTNMKYPATAIDNGIEGDVGVSFTVKADGTIGAIKIVRMVDPDLEQEAIRLVKTMPKWVPAEKEGAAVDAPATIAVPFSLPD